jgi:nicotinamidase-related amidase
MTTALLVIDVQNIYTNSESELYCQDSARTVGRINQLVDMFAVAGHPIFLVRHIHKTDGSDLGRMFDFAGEAEDFNFKENADEVKYDSRLHRPGGVIEIRKNRYSAFIGTPLDEKLRKLKVERVVVCGFMTNFCCESAARDAHDRDYFVDFVTDATGTPGTENMDEQEVRRVVGDILSGGFACVMTTRKCLKRKYK